MQKIMVDRDNPLWALKAESWTLPIQVEWPEKNDVASVRLHPDVRFTNQQRAAANLVLGSGSYVFEGKYQILAYRLSQIAVQVKTDNPEDLVEWHGKVGERLNTELKPDMKDFIWAFCQTEFANDPEKFKFTWAALCKMMLEWLIIHRRVVDLGFCEISALPYRAGWKNQAFLGHLKKNNLDIKRTAKSIKREMARVKQELGNPTLLAASGSPSFALWRLEVYHKNAWWKNVIRIEKEKRKRYDYWNSLKLAIQKSMPYAMRSLASFAKEIIAPIPFIVKKGANRMAGIPSGWSPSKSDYVQVDLTDQICSVAIREEQDEPSGEPFRMDGEEEDL